MDPRETVLARDAVLALDLGGTWTRAAVVLPDATLVGRGHTRTPRTAAEIVSTAAGLLRAALYAEAAAASAGGAARVTAIGISAPGPLNPHTGVLIDPPNLDRSLWDFGLGPAIADALGLPAYLERDTQVAALAEGAFGAARGLTDYVYLTVSTGIGGAIVSDGRLLRGPDGLAGELGHMTIDVNGPVCGCGARGHLEALASGTAIAREFGVEDAREVAAAEERGDERAREVMERARQAFAAAAVSIVDVFNPQRIIVGGGVATGQGDRLLEPARKQIREHAFKHQAARVELVPAALGDDVGLVGALPLVGLARMGDDGVLHKEPT